MEELIAELLLVENVWWQNKVGPFGICCVLVWLVLVCGEILGQLEKSTPPHPLPPPKVGEVLAFYII